MLSRNRDEQRFSLDRVRKSIRYRPTAGEDCATDPRAAPLQTDTPEPLRRNSSRSAAVFGLADVVMPVHALVVAGAIAQDPFRIETTSSRALQDIQPPLATK